MTRNLDTNSPVALIPSWSATPMGANSRPGIFFASLSGSSKIQPFSISLLKASAKYFSCFKADL